MPLLELVSNILPVNFSRNNNVSTSIVPIPITPLTTFNIFHLHQHFFEKNGCKTHHAFVQRERARIQNE
ncbi:unnamed protein product [Lathyrus oleraceus]